MYEVCYLLDFAHELFQNGQISSSCTDLLFIFKISIQRLKKTIFLLVIAIIAKVSLIVEKISLFYYVAS